MPMTATQMEAEIVLLKARVDRLTTVNTEQTQRIEALEKAGSPVQLARIADALNQFGQHYTAEAQHQTLVPKPSRPWGNT